MSSDSPPPETPEASETRRLARQFLRDGTIPAGLTLTNIEPFVREVLACYAEAQAQKTEAVGRLAGGIAHEFNNLLTIINGYSELLLTHFLVPPTREHDLVTQIRKAGERAAVLTRQLLAFAQRTILTLSSISLNQIVEDMHMLLLRTLGERVELTMTLAPDLWRVRADPAQLEQVILNAVVNAHDAMPTGGRLYLETANVTLTPELLRRLPEARGREYVRLTIRDTGTGMTEEVKQHLFEPFFTTKGPDKGSGLGLATAYGIVRQSEGHLLIDSEPGQGTTFQVYLPRLEAAAETPAPLAPTPPVAPATVLLVEADDGVRQLTRQALQRQGYQVLEASNGREALDLVQAHAGQLDLLVADVVMPQMSGPELARRLRAELPDLKVLFLSGYADERTLRHVLQEQDIPLLQKPFTVEGLARKVREILER